jgi:putative ABC transport system permease protein
MHPALLSRLVRRNLFRHPLRSVLTIGGVAIAILAFVTLRTFVDSWYAQADAAPATRLVTRNATSLAFRLPLAYRAKIQQVDGVRLVSYGTWFGGIYAGKKNAFPQFAIQPESYLELHPEYVLPTDEKTAFLRDRGAAIAGRQLASRYGWQVGDVITLKGSSYPGNWEFVLRGIYRGVDEYTDERTLFFHWEALNNRLREQQPTQAGQVGAFLVGIERPEDAATISQAIDELFQNSLAQTRTETQKAFQLGFLAMSQTIITTMQAVGFVVIGIVLAVLSNSLAMTVRERVRELCTLRALGFGPFALAALIFGESLAIGITGGIWGVLLAFPAVLILNAALDDRFPLTTISGDAILMGLAMAVLVSMSAALLPAWRFTRIAVTEGLRGNG